MLLVDAFGKRPERSDQKFHHQNGSGDVTQPIWIRAGPTYDEAGEESEDMFTEGEGYTEDDYDYEAQDTFDEEEERPASYELEAEINGVHHLDWLQSSLIDGGGTAAPSPVLHSSHPLLNSFSTIRPDRKVAPSLPRGRVSPAHTQSGTRSPRHGRPAHERDRHYPRQPKWR